MPTPDSGLVEGRRLPFSGPLTSFESLEHQIVALSRYQLLR